MMFYVLKYISFCSSGRYRLELLLERIPLESEHKANTVLSLASERGMTDLVLTTCKVMGMKALRENRRIGTAMAWALRSQVCVVVRLQRKKST